MADKTEINLYHSIFSLPEDVTSPDHYELLGLTLFESDPNAIHRATVSRNQELLKWENSQYHADVERLMDEIVAAREVLVDEAAKQRYDEELRSKYPDSAPRPPAEAIRPKPPARRQQKPAPVVASADGLTGAAQEIAALCKQLQHTDYHYADQIPSGMLENATKALAILRGERVIAFVDCTLQGTGEEGMAICETGLYWRSGGDAPKFTTWFDLYSDSVKSQGAFGIAMGDAGLFDLSGSGCDRDWLLRRLQEMLVLVGRHVSIEGPQAGKSSPSRFANVPASSSVVDSLQKLCSEQDHPDFYFGEGAPVDGDRVVAFVDCTRRGTGEQGMAICEKGLYWRNANQAQQFINWADVNSAGVKRQGKSAIAIGQVGAFDLANSDCDRDWLIGFLGQLQVELLTVDTSPAEETSAGEESGGRIAELTRNYVEYENLYQFLTRFDQPDYYVGNTIPADLLQTVARSFAILRGEIVIALVEASFAGGGEAGLAICETGLYWRNENMNKSAGFTPWVDFTSATLRPVAGDTIALGEAGAFQLAASGCDRGQLLHMLTELQQLARAEGLG